MADYYLTILVRRRVVLLCLCCLYLWSPGHDRRQAQPLDKVRLGAI